MQAVFYLHAQALTMNAGSCSRSVMMTMVTGVPQKFSEYGTFRGIRSSHRTLGKFDKKWTDLRHTGSFLIVHKYCNFQLLFRIVKNKTRPS